MGMKMKENGTFLVKKARFDAGFVFLYKAKSVIIR